MAPSYGPLQAIQLLSETFLSKVHSLWNIRPFRDFGTPCITHPRMSMLVKDWKITRERHMNGSEKEYMKMWIFGNKRERKRGEKERERERDWERERERQPVWVLCLLRRSSEIYRQRHSISSHRRAFATKAAGAGLAATSTTSESMESYPVDTEIPAAARRPRSTRGSQKWSNVRAVMALYSSLRKIKRYSRH